MSLRTIVNTFVGMFVCVIFVAALKRHYARAAALSQKPA
jgi:hypothetical protein